jgi:hypothetical protein
MNETLKKIGWLFLFTLFASEVAAYAATYNFYFNNTEQGDNSTATPNVVVNDGKKEGGKSLEPKNPALDPAASSQATSAAAAVPGPAPSSASGQQSTAALPADAVSPPEFRHVRLTAGATDLLGAMGASVGIGYFFNREFGFNAFGVLSRGDYKTFGANGTWSGTESWTGFDAGLEMEVTPVRIAVGRIEDLLDLGGMLGVSTIAADTGNWVSPHLGARLNINLGSRWGITTTARLNASYAMAEAGLVFKL